MAEKVEIMRTWSVQHERNSWENDLFNGTFEECVEYCERNEFEIDGENCRLAEIETDADGTVTFTHKIVNEL